MDLWWLLSGPNKHQSAVTCLQFNSKFVVTSSDDGTVKLWDVKTGEKCLIIIIIISIMHLKFKLKEIICIWFLQVISSATLWHLNLEGREASSGGFDPRQQSWWDSSHPSFLGFWLTFVCFRCVLLGRATAQRRRSWWFWTLTPKPSDEDSFRTRPIKPISLY